MLERLLELKDEFMRRNPKWVFGLIDYIDDIKVMDKAVYLVIKSEEEDFDKNKTVDIAFYFCRSRVKDNFIPFRNEANDFKELIRGTIEDWHFKATRWNVSYGITSDKDSIRVAEVNVTFDITQMKKEPDYEILQRLYLEI